MQKTIGKPKDILSQVFVPPEPIARSAFDINFFKFLFLIIRLIFWFTDFLSFKNFFSKFPMMKSILIFLNFLFENKDIIFKYFRQKHRIKKINILFIFVF